MAFVKRHLPAVLLGAVILWMSGGRGSAHATGSWAEPFMSWLGFPPDVAWVIHRAFRKLGHLTAYGLFAVLALRSVRGDRPTTGGFAAKALGIAVLLASTDETMQSFASERGGSALDVLLDACGAALALFFLLRSARRRLATNLGGGAR